MTKNRTIRLSRRTLLRGLGATVALPFLEEMRPRAAKAQEAVPPRVLTATLGGGLAKEWQAGDYFGSVLAPLRPFEEKLAFVRGLQGRDNHGPANAALMTGADWIKDVPVTTAPTIDWTLATRFYPEGLPGPLPFLGYGTRIRREENLLQVARAWDDTPSPVGFPHFTPSALFRAIFGRPPTQSAEEAAGEAAADATVVDAVLDQYRHFAGDAGGLSMASRRRLSDHMDQIQSLERAVGGLALEGCDAPELPPDVVLGFIDDIEPRNDPRRSDVGTFLRQGRVMTDLFVLALRCDLTRFGHAVLFPLAAHGIWRGSVRDAAGRLVDFDALRASVSDLNRHGDWHNTNHLLPRHAGEARERALTVAAAYRQPGVDLLAHLLEGLDAPESVESNGRTILDNAVFFAVSELATNHDGDGVFHALGTAGERFRTGVLDVPAGATTRQLYDTVLDAFDAPRVNPDVAFGAPGTLAGVRR